MNWNPIKLAALLALLGATMIAAPAANAHGTDVPYHTRPSALECHNFGQVTTAGAIRTIMAYHPSQVRGYTNEWVYYRLVSARWTNTGWFYERGAWASAYTTPSGLITLTGAFGPWNPVHQNAIDVFAGVPTWIGYEVFYSSRNYLHPTEWLVHINCR